MRHRKSLCRFLVSLATCAAAAAPASAVILGRDARDGLPAPADSPWKFSGQPGGFLGTAIAPNFFITAEHIGGSVGQTFAHGGRDYTMSAYFDHPDSDLRIWQVDGDLGPYAPLDRAPSAAGKELFIIGRGTDRGEALTTAAGAIVGWKWGADNGIQRWGTNVAGDTVIDESPGVGALLTATFQGGTDATVSSGDSGGGFFVNDNGTWKLAGVAHSIDNEATIDGETFTGALLGQTMYASSISANAAWIDSVIGDVPSLPQTIAPEPTSLALLTLATVPLTLRRRRQR
jgi:hypothetical protein